MECYYYTLSLPYNRQFQETFKISRLIVTLRVHEVSHSKSLKVSEYSHPYAQNENGAGSY